MSLPIFCFRFFFFGIALYNIKATELNFRQKYIYIYIYHLVLKDRTNAFASASFN